MRAKELVKQLTNSKTEIVLPTIVLFELLNIYKAGQESERNKFLKEVTESGNYKIYEYGVACANIGSSIYSEIRMKKNDFKDYKRSKLTIDLMIFGTALSCGASKLYTDNLKDFNLIKNLLPPNIQNVPQIEELPEIVVQSVDFKGMSD